MSKRIIVNVHNDQVRVAVMEEGVLVEFYMESDENQTTVGNIYRGKVENVLPGMQAVFVDIGHKKNAFLYVGDMATDTSVFEFDGGDAPNKRISKNKIRDIIRPGQEITVQVLKEAIGTKGARISTNITLPGRYMVLMPTVDYIGVSRKIEDENERKRLKEIADEIKPKDIGLIVRTVAHGLDDIDEFKQDVLLLEKLWNNIKEKEWRGRVPRLLHRDAGLIYRTVRDIYTEDVDEFLINNEQHYESVLELVDVVCPQLKDRVKLYKEDTDIFERFGIETKVEKAIQKKVWLKNGGYIVIDSTEALTVIDVNTGKFVGNKNLEDTVLKTNLEAALEIAHQIRLRDIGGIVVIDFIDMNNESEQQLVIKAMEKQFKKDRTKTNIVGFTGLGLLEMTRKKVRKRLSAALLEPCPYCNGTGKVYSQSMIVSRVEKELERIFSSSNAWGAVVETHPSVAEAWFQDRGRELDVLEKTLNRKVYINSNPNLHVEETIIKPIHGEEDMESILINYVDAENYNGKSRRKKLM